jgi:hypothetical protein
MGAEGQTAAGPWHRRGAAQLQGIGDKAECRASQVKIKIRTAYRKNFEGRLILTRDVEKIAVA